MKLYVFIQKAIMAIYTLTFIIVLAKLDPFGFYVTFGMVMNTLSTFLSNIILPKIAPNMSLKKGFSKAFMGLIIANILLLFKSLFIIIISSLIAIPSSLFIYYLEYYNIKQNVVGRERGLKDLESTNNLGFITGYITGLIFTTLYGYIFPIYLAVIIALSTIIVSSPALISISESKLKLNNIDNMRLYPSGFYLDGSFLKSVSRINKFSIINFISIKTRYKRIMLFLILISSSIGFSYTYLTPYLVLKGIKSNEVYLLTLIAALSTYFSTELSVKVYNGPRSILRMLIPRIISYTSTLIFLLYLINLSNYLLFIMYIPIGFSWGFILTLYSYLTSRVDSQEHSKINFYTGISNLLSVIIAGIIFYRLGLYFDLLIATILISIASLLIYRNPYIIKGYNKNQHFLHINLNIVNRITLRKKISK